MSHCQCVVTLLLGCILAPAQAIEATVEVESKAIRLSETTTATLTVIGPKPLLVRLPTEPLADEATLNWSVAPIGKMNIEPLADGRERWRLRYRVEPFQPGKIALDFAPIEVGTQTIPIPKTMLNVTTSAEANVAGLRPWTEIETMPGMLSKEQRAWPLGRLFLLLGVLGLLLAIIVRRQRRPLSAMQQLHRRLDILHRNAETLPTTQFADELNELLRDLIRSRTGMSTPTLTTLELIAAIDNDERFPMLLNELLQQCELLRFARNPTIDNRLSLLDDLQTILDAQTVGSASKP